jgi:hypothetical protein
MEGVHVNVDVDGDPRHPRVDSEIVLSTRYGKTMVFINKTLSTETTRDLSSTRLRVSKVGSGMW